MKNLKRVLSLALAGTMLSGMMAMGASAANTKDFTDADEITHTEAVNVMSTLGVLKGKDTGAFDPTTTVTRAEMAKIICVMLNGGSDPTLGTGGTPKFTDVTTHWARSYIEYCANLGIINGLGDGTFAPDAPVTGAAAAKMLLVALGYDADIAGFTGVDWQVSVDSEANKAKLYDEIKGIDTSAGLSRDNTAQMAYNALEAKIMERTDTKVVGTGQISYTYEQSKDTTFLNEYFDAYTFVGQMDGNADTLDLTEGHIQVSGDLDTVDTSGKDYEPTVASFPSDFDIANIGEEVKVIFKDGKGGTKGAPDKNDTIYGVFNTGATEVVNAIKADVKDNKAEETKIKVGSQKYNLAETVTVWNNYVGDGVEYKDAKLKGSDKGGDDGKGVNSQLTTDLKGTNGDAIKMVLKDGKVNRIYVTKTVLAVVTSKNSSKITINNGVGTLEIKDHDIAEDLKVDDVVVVTVLYKDKATDEGAKAIVAKAESVSGEVGGFKDKENVKLDGTTYKIYGKTDMKDLGLDDQETSFKADHIGEDFTLYLVNGYVAAAVQTSESASNYSVVLEASKESTAGSTFDALRLRVMDAAGVKSTITVSDDSDKKTTADYAVGTIITYTTNKDGEADVTIVADYKVDAPNNKATSYEKGTKSFNEVVTSADCVLFATTKTAENGTTSDIKAYKIRDLGKIEAAEDKWVAVEKDSKIVAVYIDLGNKPTGATSSTVYGIVSASNGTVKVDGTTYKQFIVDSNGEQYTINISTTNTELKKGQIVSFDPASDNTYGKDDVKAVETGAKLFAAYVDSYDKDDKIVTIFTQITKVMDGDVLVGYEGDKSTQKTYAVLSDVDMYFVDVDGDKGVESGSVTKFDTTEGYANVILVLNNDEEVEAMIVETSGEESILEMPAANEPACEHELTATAEKAPTCTVAGNIAYWTCSKCHKTFSDENGETEVTETSVDATGHDYAWSALTEVDGEHQVGEHKGVCSKGDSTVYHAADAAEADRNGCTLSH